MRNNFVCQYIFFMWAYIHNSSESRCTGSWSNMIEQLFLVSGYCLRVPEIKRKNSIAPLFLWICAVFLGMSFLYIFWLLATNRYFQTTIIHKHTISLQYAIFTIFFVHIAFHQNKTSFVNRNHAPAYEDRRKL